MRELAYIQKISSLSPIPGADAIEKAEVLGWELVVKKGEFHVGDLCVYCEIDSILPELPCFEFLRARKFRIKTVKLRGQVSQGIAFPLSILRAVDPSFDGSLTIGRDVTETLKITKYDPEAALEVKHNQVKKPWYARKFNYLKWKLFGIKPVRKGNFPEDIPKTDETRVQKMATALEEREGHSVYITEKCEGTSSTFVYREGGNWLARLLNSNGSFQICSRNTTVFNSQTGKEAPHFLRDVAKKYDIHKKMKALGRSYAIQGEVIGPKIQGNIYQLPELELKVFSIFNLETQEYLSYYEMCNVADQLGLTTVPVLQINISLVNDVKYWVEYSKGTSRINPKILREGVVIRSMSDNFSFKSINPEYLLKQE
jgi:hypothetical protein